MNHRSRPAATTLEAPAFGSDDLLVALRAAGVAASCLDLTTGVGVTTPEWTDIIGLPPDPEAQTFDAFLALVHPDDRARVAALHTDPDAVSQGLDFEFRINHPIRGERWLHSRSLPVGSAGNGTLRLVGIAKDVTERKRFEATLRESETRYRTLFASIDEGFCVIEKVDTAPAAPIDFRYAVANPAFTAITGLTDVVGKTIREVVPGVDDWLAIYDTVLRTGEPLRFERELEPLGLVLDLYAFPLSDEGHRRLAVLFKDVTARKQATEALRASEARQSFLLRLSDALRPLIDPVAIQRVAAQVLGKHLAVDRAYYVAVDRERGEYVVEQEWHRSGAPSHARRYPLAAWPMPWLVDGEPWVVRDVDSDPALPDEQRDAYRDNDIGAAVVVPLIKDGELVATLVVNQHEPRGWTPAEIALVEEVAERTWAAVERARAEAALRESEAALQQRVTAATSELRTLSRRLLTVQEEERRHLARELHDEIGQMLTGLGFQLAAASGKGGASALAEAQATVQALTDQVRQLSMDLRPAVLDIYGLLAAVQWYVEGYQKRTGIRVDVRHEGVASRIPAEMEITAYRVVQEALTNVARHAQTDFVTVQLLADGILTLTIRDTGRGFDPTQTSDTSGLGGLRERVALLGGTIEIESAPGAGTVVMAELPLDAPGDPEFEQSTGSGGAR